MSVKCNSLGDIQKNTKVWKRYWFDLVRRIQGKQLKLMSKCLNFDNFVYKLNKSDQRVLNIVSSAEKIGFVVSRRFAFKNSIQNNFIIKAEPGDDDLCDTSLPIDDPTETNEPITINYLEGTINETNRIELDQAEIEPVAYSAKFMIPEKYMEEIVQMKRQKLDCLNELVELKRASNKLKIQKLKEKPSVSNAQLSTQGTHWPKRSGNKFAYPCHLPSCMQRTRYVCSGCENVSVCPECMETFHSK